MAKSDERASKLRRIEQREHQSWADGGTVVPSNELLRNYVASFTYSVGCLREQDAKFITRAYPTVMTTLYFEFCGELSEVKDSEGGFALARSIDSVDRSIQKRTYLKTGLGSWFDIYQLASQRDERPIKNLKIDLYPSALYQLFRLSPEELVDEDIQLADLIGETTSQLMLEEMEATDNGQALVQIVERYFLRHLSDMSSNKSRDLQTIPRLPTLDATLFDEARRYRKGGRWLQKRYTQVYGMSFKKMQKNIRFLKAHQLISHDIGKSLPSNLTDLALRAGYYDQAHFIREFKHYSGVTPGQYLRANFESESHDLFYW